MSIKQITSLLTPKEKGTFGQIIFWLSLRVVFDIISLASLLPLVLSYFAPETLKENKIWIDITTSLGIELEKTTTVLIVIISFFFLLKFVYFYFIERKKARFLTSTQHRLIVTIYDRMAHDYFSTTGQTLENTTQIPPKYVFQCLDTLFRIIPNIITIVLILTGLIWLQWKIFITVCLVFTPMLGLYLLVLKRPTKKVKESFSQLNPVFLQGISEAFRGRIEIAVFQKHSYFKRKIQSSSRTLTESMARLLTLSNSSNSFLELIAIIGIGGFFFYIIHADLTSEQSITILSAFILSTVKIIPSLNGIVTATTNFRAYNYTVDSLRYLIEKNYGAVPRKNVILPTDFRDRIDFKEIRVNYPESDFELPEVNLSLLPNDKVAIMGESGSGKSTILKLILKLVPASSGSIIIDGKSLETLDTASWWELIAYVPQSPFIFSGSLLENLVFDRKPIEAEKNEIAQLLKDLRLDSLLENLPKGLDSKIEEKGNNLSNGQKQRIGIARAILRDCPIYIFDEITNGLDDKTRLDVIHVILKRHLKNRLCIFATHDSILEKECNKVLYLST